MRTVEEKRAWAMTQREQFGITPDMVQFVEEAIAKDEREIVTPQRLIEALVRERPDLAIGIGRVGISAVLETLIDTNGNQRFIRLIPSR